MDTLSHALWGKGLFGYRGHGYISLLFGASHDLITFFPWMLIKFINGTFFDLGFGKPPLETIPDWVFLMYNFSHSFITGFLVVLFFYFVRKNYLWFAALAWPFHIVLDFPFHTKDFFPTKIIWPISDFSFDGISWMRAEVWFANLGLLALLFIYRYCQKRVY